MVDTVLIIMITALLIGVPWGLVTLLLRGTEHE